MKNGSVQNYLKSSKKLGDYSYRRRIPERYKHQFVKPDGKLRGREWNESLKTKSKSKALRLAAEVNDRFERTLEFAKLGEASSNRNKTDQQKLDAFIETMRRLGVHPDQAPSVLEPKHVQQEFFRRQKDVIYDLKDYQEEVGIESIQNYDGSDGHKTNELYFFVQSQIDFLKGDKSSIKNRMKVTLEVALDTYLQEKFYRFTKTVDASTQKKIDRVHRIVKAFASFIGSSSTTTVMSVRLAEITRRQVKSWLDYEMNNNGRSGATVGRDVTFLNSIYNLAIIELNELDAALTRDSNPFSGQRGYCEQQDQYDLSKGKRVKISARAWTPKEVELFEVRIPLMNEQAALIAKLAMFTGARLKDCSGLLVGELKLNDDINSKICFRNNIVRDISKDSIERDFPIYGDMLRDLKDYVSAHKLNDDDRLTPRYGRPLGSDDLSTLLNNKHIDTYSKDPSLKMHGLRNTLQSRFNAADVSNKLSGYLIGWRNQQTVGMQEEYMRDGYPQSLLLETLIKGRAIKEWASLGD